MQYETPYSYITRITAQADAEYSAQRAHDVARRAAKRQRVAAARAYTQQPGKITWRKVGRNTFVSSRGGWKIVKHDNNAAGFELTQTIDGRVTFLEFFDTLGECKKVAK